MRLSRFLAMGLSPFGDEYEFLDVVPGSTQHGVRLQGHGTRCQRRGGCNALFHGLTTHLLLCLSRRIGHIDVEIRYEPPRRPRRSCHYIVTIDHP